MILFDFMLKLWHHFTYREYHEQHQYQFPCKMVSNHKRRLSFQPTILQPQSTIPRNDHLSIANHQHDNDSQPEHLASDDLYNCKRATVYLCDIEPNMHYNYNDCKHREYFHHYSDNFSVRRSHHEFVDHFRCFW